MFTSLLLYILLAVLVRRTQCLCGENIKWSHSVNMEDVFGVWYGVGYAQHNPDWTNVPNEVGCVTLYITDDNEYGDNWFDRSMARRNDYSQFWWSTKSNPWPDNSVTGTLDSRFKRKVKRNVDGEKRVRVLWDEDGHSMEQVYIYYEEEPGLWTAEQLRPMEKELISRGFDVWYPDDPPRHPDAIRLIQVTPHLLILNHCAEAGNGGIFSLILRRSPSMVERWEWYQYQQEFYRFDLPTVYRFTAICAACNEISSFVTVIICFMGSFTIPNIMMTIK